MSQSKEKYFEVLVQEERMTKYKVRANDADQARRIFEEHNIYWYGDSHKIDETVNKHIREISEHKHPPF